MSDELRFHIEQRAEDLIRGGASPHEARRQAKAELGSVAVRQEECREALGLQFGDALLTDLRCAIRQIRGRPLYSAIAILTLSIGIGGAVVTFSQLNAVFWKSPIDDSEGVRSLSWTSAKRSFAGRYFTLPIWDERLAKGRTIEYFPYSVCRALQERASSFSDVACWTESGLGILDQGGMMKARVVSGTYFETINARARLGRPLVPEDDHLAAQPAAVISYDAWQRVYGAATDIVGRSISIGKVRFTIVGVLSESFSGVDATIAHDVLVPASFWADVTGRPFDDNSWVAGWQIFGRLRPGIAEVAAQTEASLVVQQLISASPPRDPYEPPHIWVRELGYGINQTLLRDRASTPLVIVAVTVGFILLITCTNLAGLLLVNGRARQGELAMRLALGASRIRILRQAFTETAVLSTLGAVGGIALAYSLGPILPVMLSELTSGLDSSGTLSPLTAGSTPDTRAIAFAIAVSILTGLAFGSIPAISAGNTDLQASLRKLGGSKGGSYRQAGIRWLLTIQVATSMLLLIGAGLMIRSVAKLGSAPSGYRPEGVLFSTVNPQPSTSPFVEDTLIRLKGLPGVTAAAASQWPLFNNATQKVPICVDGQGSDTHPVDFTPVTSDFFETWGIEFLSGESFRSSESVAIVNATFAKTFFGNRNPLDHSVRESTCNGRTRRIVAVVGDHSDRPRESITPMVYIPYNPRIPSTPITFSIRGKGSATLVPGVRRVLAATGASIETDVQTGVAYRQRTMRRERSLALLLTVFGSIALGIASIGIYGILAYSLSLRQREVAIRAALGASRTHIASTILSHALKPILLGGVLGVVLAFGASRWLESLLFGVAGWDPVVIVGACAVLSTAACIAAIRPLLQSISIDSLRALRNE